MLRPRTPGGSDRAALRETLKTHFGFDLDVDALRVPQIPEWT